MINVGILNHGPVLPAVIHVPPDIGWRFLRSLSGDEYQTIAIDEPPHPLFDYEFKHAKESGRMISVTVGDDEICLIEKASLWLPGQEDFVGNTNGYRLEYFGDGFKRVEPDNNSWWQKRLECPPEIGVVEKAFAAHWLKENDESQMYAVNSGMGILQDIMLSTHRYESPPDFQPWVTNRERKIVATVIQWLGTNCGRSFLYEVERRAGKKVTA